MKNSPFLIGLVAVLTLSPLVSYLPQYDREEVYRAIDGRRSIELSHYLNIFKNQGAVDVAFVGLSSLWVGVNARQMQDYFTARGAAEPQVIMLGANHPGEDLVYMMVADLLENRDVKVVVLSSPNRIQQYVHPLFHRLASMKDHSEVWHTLPAKEMLRSYGLAMLGAPLQIYSMIKPARRPRDARNTNAFNGSWVRSDGWNKQPFVAREIASPYDAQRSIDRNLHEGSDIDAVDFGNVQSVSQRAYFRATIELIKAHGALPVVVSVPIWKDRNRAKPLVRIPKASLSDYEVPLVAVSPKAFFAGMSEEDIEMLYYNENHFNTNGSTYHTEVLAPVFWELARER